MVAPVSSSRRKRQKCCTLSRDVATCSMSPERENSSYGRTCSPLCPGPADATTASVEFCDTARRPKGRNHHSNYTECILAVLCFLYSKTGFWPGTAKSQPIWIKFCTHCTEYVHLLWADLLDRDQRVAARPNHFNDCFFFL